MLKYVLRIVDLKSVDLVFKIWLCLIGLTLISASIAESANISVYTTLFVCCIVIVKGRWVINDFMGLKYAAPLTRNIVKGYFYSMTCIVGAVVIYSQNQLSI
jgi:hypothetical protein